MNRPNLTQAQQRWLLDELHDLVNSVMDDTRRRYTTAEKVRRFLTEVDPDDDQLAEAKDDERR